jgi:ABC-2 type transport system ATP-binding protein
MIRVSGLTHRYGSALAVDDVSFEVEPGEIVGFLGPNGAGKSTVLKVVSTWMPPTAGEVTVAGHDVVREGLAVRRALGYLPEHNALWDVMRVEALLRFVGRMHGLRGAALAERIEWAVSACSLSDVMKKRVQQCSKGYRQRIGLAAALLHDPRVVLLDEPTHGLDPLQVVAFQQFLAELRPGRAILFSSHVLPEVMAVSDRLLVIQRGRLLLDERVERLREHAAEAGCTVEEHVLDVVRSDAQATEPAEVAS